MGRGVPPALSRSDPVAIYLFAQKTPCPNLEITPNLISWFMVSLLPIDLMFLWSI